MKNFWNDRYSTKEYAYGIEPNQYFKASLDHLSEKGKILLPAEGEGRNAVYAAQQGFDVHAFDTSLEGQKKAFSLAQNKAVQIQYLIGDMAEMQYKANSFDVVGLIFAHFPPSLQATYHQQIAHWLKPNGVLIFEGFSKNNLELLKKNPKVGGPKNPDMLFSKEQLMKDFSNFTFLEIQEKIINLNEGDFHIGESSVIRFVASLNS